MTGVSWELKTWVQCVKAWTLVESIKLHISSISPYGSWMYEYNMLISIAQSNESKVFICVKTIPILELHLSSLCDLVMEARGRAR